MPRCNGCSKSFPALPPDTRCGRCIVKKSRPVAEWGGCVNCGAIFEHLDADTCASCIESLSSNGTVNLAREATSNPVNPRAHTGPDGRLSLSARITDSSQMSTMPGDDERRAHAAQILSHMSSGYNEAVSRAVPGLRIAPSKLKTSINNISRPVRKLNVKISKVTDYDNGKYRSGPVFNAISIVYHEDALMSTILNDILTTADNAYTQSRGYRVFSLSEIQLLWMSSKTVVDPVLLNDTLGALWREVSSNTFFISASDARRKVVDFHVVVHVDPERDELRGDQSDEPQEQAYATRQSKRANSIVASDLRAASTSTDTQSKRPKLTAAGRNVYKSVVHPTTATSHNVIKGCFIRSEADDTGATSFLWTEDEEPQKVVVEKREFASGTTKKAYKMLLDQRFYAAKRYFNVGDDETGHVSKEDNLTHLKDELLRQFVASDSIQRFLDSAKKFRISVYSMFLFLYRYREPLTVPSFSPDMKTADSFILTVVSGLHQGESWLVDPLLSEDAEIRKFSGSAQAGKNDEDLVGRTCDAFAHFSLFDSDCNIVFVDIQGFDSETLPLSSKHSIKSSHCLILLDLMIHSIDYSYGLGDEGELGIEQFVKQHVCNAICKGLRLPPARELWKQYGPCSEPDRTASPKATAMGSPESGNSPSEGYQTPEQGEE
ncbi:hypothetical protein CVT24_008286 [Panaeolus cyanescens]|uniref:Alpha-type protein kinase domain-containing protein n=1 Tax=Panaeolus cyanescens TaxID=181874 RepID=A0A409YQI2_9AGAR|nr:hypothetical protein CVT24_008286 [Panaeolus cyanescens]